MARRNRNSNNWYEEHKYYLVPAGIGGVIAWIFSQSLGLGLAVFVAVWIGSWVGHKLLAK